MELDLKELGFTFAVGAFTILGIEAILYHFFGKHLTGFFKGELGFRRRRLKNAAQERQMRSAKEGDEESVRTQPMTVAVFIAIAFAIGILAEDLSYKYVDNVETPFRWLPAKISSLLPRELDRKLGLRSKEGSRIATLVKNLREEPEVQPLALDLAQNGAFSLIDPQNGARVEAWLKA